MFDMRLHSYVVIHTKHHRGSPCDSYHRLLPYQEAGDVKVTTDRY